MQLENLLNKVPGAALLVLLGGVACMYLFDGSDAEAGAPAIEADEQIPSHVGGSPSPDSRLGVVASLAGREASPANDLPWRAPDVDTEILNTLLKNPASTFDVFDSVEWAETNAWIGVPDIGGPWSIARLQCAAEKLGTVTQDPCDYNVNLVLRRRADGNGDVVGAIAEFDLNLLSDEPDIHGPDPSLASARCQNFARCLVARGYAGLVAPLGPGPEGEFISLQFGGREVPRAGAGVDPQQLIDGAITATLAQIKLLEEDPEPGDLGWEFNTLMLQRALDYYKWLSTQV